MNPPFSSRPLRVLIADDDPMIVAVLERALAGKPCRVSAARTAPALEAAGREGIDLSLLDMHMPGVDLVGALDRLVRSAPGAAVLLMTGEPQEDLVARCRTLGALGPVLKPFSVGEIGAWVGRFAAPADPRPGGARVLLVEDELDQLAQAWDTLLGLGCRITPTASAEAALRLAAERRFDAILSDNVLPGMTALQALPRLRATGSPVIVMSRQHGPDLEADARLLGAAACLRKPLAAAEIGAVLRRVCGGA